MKYLSPALAFIALSAFIFIPPVRAVTVPPAYQESITTPHWRWEGRNVGGTVRALFITQSYAIRDPDELAQRFDIAVDTLGVPGQPPNGLSVDNVRLAKLLANRYDAIVITPYYANDIFERLTPANRSAIIKMVREGATLVVGRGCGVWPQPRPSAKTSDDLLGDLLDGALDKPAAIADGRLTLGYPDHDNAAPAITTAAALARALPTPQMRPDANARRTHGPFYRGGLSTATLPLGNGRVVYTFGVAGHWISFNALLGEDVAWPTHGNPGAFFDDPVAPELHFAVVARWLRKAVGKEGEQLVRAAAIQDDPAPLNTPNALLLTFSKAVAEGATVTWTLYSPMAEALASNTVTLTAAKFDAALPFTPTHAGPLICQWRLEQDGVTLDAGAAAFVASASVELTDVATAVPPVAAEPLNVTWHTSSPATARHKIALQMYDPDGRLVALATTPAAAGQANLAPWPWRHSAYTLRALLLADDKVIDEKRLPVIATVNRAHDADDYLVAAWAMEGGMGTWQGRYRTAMLRDLGIATFVGNNGGSFYRMLAEAGMRPTLCNIFHPASRGKPGYDAVKATERLANTAAAAAPYAPVGYMLGDEPGDLADVGAYTSQAAATIRQADPGARVGWSGVWLGFKHDVPDFFKTCGYITAYSPHHLYTPNLWLGVERDLYRSFKQPGTILTCWTHYAPWADNEPYSRTVPWLWLFEGMNGVSYFSTADEFAILPGDLRSTHETRWWSEEVKTLKNGIGKQLVGMERDNGGVRILFTRHASGSETWMRALNQLNIPYRLCSRAELANGLGPEVKLLIAPEPLDLDDKECAGLRACAAAGGMVVAIGPALTNSASLLEATFGVVRVPTAPDYKTSGNIDAKIAIGAPVLQNAATVQLSGKTTGEHGWRATSGQSIATFAQLGEKSSASDLGPLTFLQPLFDTPAATAKKHDRGLAFYLNFRPDLPSTKLLLTNLIAHTTLPPPVARITCAATPADTIYLYPFKEGNVTMLGVVQDYWRVPPAWDVVAASDDAVKEATAQYYHHGPAIWATNEASLTLAAPRHLYDARTGHYFGLADKAQITLQAGRPELFALLPYRVERLTITAPQQAQPGEIITLAISLASGSATPGRHIAHVALAASQHAFATERHNVELRHGQATLAVQVPYNAPAGKWQATARDAISGTQATAEFSVSAAPPPLGGILQTRHPQITRNPLDWPQGGLVSHAAAQRQKEEAQAGKVAVSGATLTAYALPQHWGQYANQKGLKANFTLRNPLAYYQMRYEVCNDWQANGWEQGRIWAHYKPGLGINRPAPMPWYYNGYLVITLDDMSVADYAATAVTAIPSGDNGRVDVTFDTPSATVTLAFAMLPDHLGLFQQLTINPKAPIRNLKLAFRRLDWGGKDKPHSFINIDPEEHSWALTGDRLEDRAFGKGSGPAAMLVEPSQWDSVNFTPPAPTLQKAVNLQAGQTFKTGWVLWLFPTHTNEQAHNYLRDNSAATRKYLSEIFKP